MGERKRKALRVDFDGQIRLEFHGAKVTSDAGLLAYRELDEALRLTAESEAVRSVLAETCLGNAWGKQNRLMEEKTVDFQTSFG